MEKQMLLGSGKLIRVRKKKWGVIGKDKVFRSYRKEAHKFRVYDGWGINKELLKELLDVGVKFWEIHTEKRVLKIKLDAVIRYGISYKNPKKEKDYQLIVPEKWFERRHK